MIDLRDSRFILIREYPTIDRKNLPQSQMDHWMHLLYHLVMVTLIFTLVAAPMAVLRRKLRLNLLKVSMLPRVLAVRVHRLMISTYRRLDPLAALRHLDITLARQQLAQTRRLGPSHAILVKS